MSVQAILFDAVGTLFRVRGSVGHVYARVAARHGVQVDAGTIEARFRAAFQAMPPLCFPGVREPELPTHERAWWKRVVATAFADWPGADFDAFFSDLFEHFTLADSWELFPDVEPALCGLRSRGIRLGIVSNFDGRLTAVCSALGIAHYFSTVIMSGRMGYAKPDPRIFTMALTRLGVAATNSLHIGDSEVEDVEGARAAGIRAVLIDRQRGRTTARPDCLRDLRELLA